MIKKILLASLVLTTLTGCGHKGKAYKADPMHLTEFQNVVGSKVLFDLNSCALSSIAENTLQKQAVWLNNHKLYTITVEGHCDERGTTEYNLALGEKRAKSVKDFLVRHGIDSARVSTVSYGKERPAVLGHNAESWTQNRRAVTVIK